MTRSIYLTCFFVQLIALNGVCRTAASEIITIAGSGKADYSGDGGPALKAGLNNPFGLEITPDGMLYFCDFGNHAVRRFDIKMPVVSTVAGTGGKHGYAGDGGPATEALLFEPHEIRLDREGNFYLSDMKTYTIRRVDAKTGIITTVAGTGNPGFAGDGGPATKALLGLPIAVSLDIDNGLLICDIKNHRIRRVDLVSGTISTFAGTGESNRTTDGGPVANTPLNGPRSLAVDTNGDIVLVLREGNAVYRINRKSMTVHHVGGTGKQGYAGDGGDARLALVAGPKGIALDRDGNILLCDTENHAVRIIHKSTGIIETLIGDGKSGDGPDGDPRKCRLTRPHGVFIDRDGAVYIGDSGNNKIRKLTR